MLDPYRVLDLTDVRGQIAGMLFADLGADVIRVEPPGGSSARYVGPQIPTGPETERSLSFAAYNRGKRSVELELMSDEGRAAFLGLVEGADFVFDSGPPSLLDSLGLGSEALRRANPRIVHVRVTPFGSDGPYAEYPAADLTVAALGGPMSLQGDADRAPLRLSVPQVWRHAGAEAAVAALVAHARMRTTGEAIFVDVSAQSAMTWTMLNGALAHAIQGTDYERAGSALQIGPVGMELVHRAADGHIVTLRRGVAFLSLLPWLLEDGIVDQAFVDREDWSTYDYRVFRGGEFAVPREELYEVFDRFYAKHTKAELFRRGLEMDLTHAPVQTIDDLVEFDQLADREYFLERELPDRSRVRAPGAFVKTPGATPGGPAPRLGEHTREILDELARAPREPARVEVTASPLPLAGLKVADFSWVGVGPISAKVLADHGADVIRVESQKRPDDLRTAGPHLGGKPGWNRSHFFAEFNTSKRGLSLDLKNENAAQVSQRLLAWADVVLESFTPGTAARLGIGYEQAWAANPSVVMASTCLMGQTGPVAHMAGYGYHAAAVAGFYELTGYPDRPPVGPWNAYTDTVAPRFLATTLLAAIDHQRRTGEGRYIDLGQMEAALQFLAPEMMSRQATGEGYERSANRSKDAAPQGTYPCAGDDQWCAIAVETEAQWESLVRVLGDPEWAQDETLATVEGRLAAHDDIDERLASWTRERSAPEVMETLLAAGVPAGRVQRSRDLLEDPQLQHRRFHREHEHGEMGRVPYSGHAYGIAGYDHGPRFAAPCLGEHSFEVLTETLAFTDEEAAELIAAGAVG